ncbi:MAG: cytochrome C [Leptolyngbya sp. SIO4C1]|nr:cytochrome C [Leptolyngbya sp. SIO4C1]
MTTPSPFNRTLLRRIGQLLAAFAAAVSLALIGVGLSQALAASDIGTVDPVAPAYQVGQALYLERCTSCHIGVPPEVLPRETWQILLNETDHYSTVIDLLPRFDSQLIANYLHTYSRPHSTSALLPFHVRDSAYFQALHPAVEFSRPPTLRTCASCHAQAEAFNFREWQD